MAVMIADADLPLNCKTCRFGENWSDFKEPCTVCTLHSLEPPWIWALGGRAKHCPLRAIDDKTAERYL